MTAIRMLAFGAALVSGALCGNAGAADFATIFQYQNGNPGALVIFSGTLYGTGFDVSNNGCGEVFQLQPPSAPQDIETPPSLACIYSLVPNLVSGCPTASTTEVPSGGSAVIVIVDAYDQPAAAADLAAFSAKYGLPQANFSVIYVSGSQPENGCASGWAAEEDLDIQYAHAMAPDAQIVLMEAADSSTATMFGA